MVFLTRTDGQASLPPASRVTARDAFGNVATGCTGTAGLGSRSPMASLPATSTFMAADAGAHTSSAALEKADTQSITVWDRARDRRFSAGGRANEGAETG